MRKKGYMRSKINKPLEKDERDQMDKNLDKVEKLNYLNTNSFWGITAALFLLLIYNNYLFQLFFYLLESMKNAGIFFIAIITFFWYIVFFMVQTGIIKVIYRKFSTGTFTLSSPLRNIKESVRFILCILLGALFFSFAFNLFYPFKVYSTSLVGQIIFYLSSMMISIGYWKYVENYNNKKAYVPKLGEYGLSGWFVILSCMLGFGAAGIIQPYSVFGCMGFGIWLIMISRFLLED